MKLALVCPVIPGTPKSVVGPLDILPGCSVGTLDPALAASVNITAIEICQYVVDARKCSRYLPSRDDAHHEKRRVYGNLANACAGQHPWSSVGVDLSAAWEPCDQKAPPLHTRTEREEK